MERRDKPFPRPASENDGINRWLIKEILVWEEAKKAA